MEVDYIVVGLGLAGLSFVSVLEENEQSFLVFEDGSQSSSLVAGGIYNPVQLKRFKPVWQAGKQLEAALPRYQRWAQKFQKTYDHKFDIYRVFASISEQNNWFSALDHPSLAAYMDPKIIRSAPEGLQADHGFGRVQHSGRIDTASLLGDLKHYLKATKKIQGTAFEHRSVVLKASGLSYKGIVAKYLVFCEGCGLLQNPFFNALPLNGVKGETLTIHAPQLRIDFMVKSSLFVVPLGNHFFKVGATFNRVDASAFPTEEGRTELQEKLACFLKVPYRIIEHSAGIRPTVKDRRPLVGVHPKHPQLALLNGLGARGVMIAPKMAQELYDHLSQNVPLNKEIDLKRFMSGNGML
jgi:glycine/D-amino acid oxidase-like deaminating enzyme